MGSDAFAHRKAWSHWVCLLLPVVLWATAPSGPATEGDSSRLVLKVDDHRPLAALARELEMRYPIVVTYEEAPWVAASDIEDVTRAIIESNGPGRPAPRIPILAPRKAAVSFEYPLHPAQGRPLDYADLLSALLFQYDAAGAPGKFRFEGDNGIYHLIPASLQDKNGRWSDVTPVFETLVRLEDAERTVDDTLDEIVAQLNASSPIRIGWGFVPLNLFNQNRVRLSADGVPAREVMHQILELLPRRATWRLNYDPTTKIYYLNFLLMPDDPRPEIK